MIRSMTGFVTKRIFLAGPKELAINIRSLNFKYLDIHISRVPWGLEELEKVIYETVIKKIKRGRLDITISLSQDNINKPLSVKKLKIKKAFREALEELLEFKELQGSLIKKDIKTITSALKKRSQFFLKYSKRIAQKKPESAKDIFEEVSLINFYLGHLDKILDKEKGELGKILDFLSQELLRETNTVLAKVKDRQFSLEAVYFKEEIDRLRELAQNIE
ncbi:MAG: DUF1732 domain-containing protein [Candidatus Omnitrophica bacterium]|nr:DUF1732 domain-containing protein [Candidatus Omnitrophota bacterium]